MLLATLEAPFEALQNAGVVSLGEDVSAGFPAVQTLGTTNEVRLYLSRVVRTLRQGE